MIKLPYVEQGDATGVPVLMLHGTTDSWRSFEPVLPHLPDDIRAIAVTHRGHGDAPKPESGYRIEDFAGDAVDLMDQLGIERAVVVGHSMGAWIAQRLLIDHSERLLGAVLAGSFSGRTADDPELVAFAQEMAATVPDPVPAQIAREFQESTTATPLDPEALDTFVNESLKVPAHVWRAVFAGLADVDHADELDGLDTPALLLWGDHDAFIAREAQDELLEQLTDSRLEIYEGVGHALHWERPERFAADLVAFSRRAQSLAVR
jgi:pimeloyl-ACP methyl ester carboxylesterase